jgi:hypothetical protein
MMQNITNTADQNSSRDFKTPKPNLSQTARLFFAPLVSNDLQH